MKKEISSNRYGNCYGSIVSSMLFQTGRDNPQPQRRMRRQPQRQQRAARQQKLATAHLQEKL